MTGLEIFFFGLLKAAVAGIAAGAVIYLLCLYWDDIVNWLQGRTSLKESDLDNIGFSLQERLSSGGYKTVYGIFNSRTNTVLDATGVSSTKIDDRLSREHRNSPLVVYQ